MKLRIMFLALVAIMLLGIAAVALAEQDPRQREITIRLRGVSLRETLDILLRDTGLTYQLPRDIEGERVTVDLEALPLEQALHAILTAQGLTYRYLPDARLYAVERVPEPAPAEPGPEVVPPEPPPTPPVTITPPPTPSLPPASGNTVTRVIPLRYADPASLALLFGGEIAPQAHTYGGYPGYPAYGPYVGYRTGYAYSPYGAQGSYFRGYTPRRYGGIRRRYGTSAYPVYGPYGGYGTGYGPETYNPPGLEGTWPY